MPVPDSRRSSRAFPHSDEELALLNPVGGLICVNMRNFMCHRNFTQNFYAGVNYITGENGSGKSAVIVALSAALGANFNKIGKGDDVSNLIGTAEPIAVVTVTLRNDPRNPRHCDKYNNPVVIERTLVRRGEAGKISNKNTIKIDGKEVRKVDLVELMTIMSIDVCNPAVVLHQDNAKSFGDCNDGKGLYKYFLSATGLHQSLEECERCKAQVLADRNNLQQCKSLQTNLREGDYAEAKQAMDRCSDLNDLRAKIEGLKGDLAVASIHEVIKKFDEKNEEMIDYRESQRECSAQHDQLQRELNEMCAEVAAVERQGNTELDSEIESIKQQLYHLNKKSQGFASELSRKGNEKNQAEQAIRKLQRQIAEEEQRRDEARREFERQDRNKGKRAATKLREEAESMLQKVEQRQAEIQEVEAETEEYQRDLQRSQAQFEDVKSGLSSVDEMIKKNKSNRGKVITRDEIIRRYKPPFFNGDFVQVRNAIDALAKKGVFRGSIPLGPLGMHVTLKPEGRKFYKPIAQALGAKNLGAFLFDNSDDLNAFKRSREYQTIPNSGLFFLTLPSSTQSVSESTPTFQSLPNSPTFSCLDLLVFDNPWVKNALIHFAKVDKNQVVEHYDKSLGHKAMDSLRGKRNGVSVTVRSIDGHECTAAVGGGISATTNSGNVPQDIFDRSETVDAESSLRELELEKQGLTRDYQLVEKERRNLSDRLKQLQDRAQRLNSDIMSFQKKRKQNLAEARELELEAEQLPQDFDESFYEDSIRSKQETMNVRKEELSRYERELELISRNNSEIQIQMKKETEKRQKVEQKAQRLTELAEEAAKKQDAKSRELEKVAAKLRRLSAAMAPMQAEITSFQVKIEEWLVKNASLGLQSVDAIKQKAQEILASRRGNIESLKKLIETDQKIYRQKEALLQLPEGGIETVNARFREQEEKLESIDREITVHLKNYKSLSDTHKLLSERYSTLRHFLCSTVEVSFEEYLQHKKYKGKMTFDHEKCTLMTTVDVNSRDSAKEAHSAGSHKNLSGGENSYSNVCLLLALSSVSPCPWQVLDEFDVFMDQNHRALALELICNSMRLESGATMCKNQLVFITPHSIPPDIAENPEVHVSVVVRAAQSESL